VLVEPTELLKQTMHSNAYKTAELVSRAEALEKEKRSLQSLVPEAERAIASAEKATGNLASVRDPSTNGAPYFINQCFTSSLRQP